MILHEWVNFYKTIFIFLKIKGWLASHFISNIYIFVSENFFLKIYFSYFYFIGKADIQRGDTERKIFHPMTHSPSERNGRYYADPKPGASSGSPTWVQVPKALGRPRLLFPGHRQGAGREAGLPGLEPAPIWDPGRARRGPLTTCATAPGPILIDFSKEVASCLAFYER